MSIRSVVLGFFFAVLFCPGLATAQAGWQWGVAAAGNESEMGAIDSFGNVYGSYTILQTSVAGSTVLYDTTYVPSLAVTKVSTSGSLLWSVNTQFGPTASWDIASDAIGNLYIACAYWGDSVAIGSTKLHGTDSAYTCFLAKVSPDGTLLWMHNVCKSTNSLPLVDVDGYGNIYISGGFSNKLDTLGTVTLVNSDTTGTTEDIFLAKYSSSGTFIWAESFGFPGDETTGSMTVTKSGNIYFAPQYDSAITIGTTTLVDSQLLLAKFDSGGTPLWAVNISPSIELLALQTDYNENIYISGNISGPVVFANDTLETTSLSDFFVAKYDPSGNAVWGRAAKGKSIGWGLSVDPCGHIWACGTIQHTMHFGTAILPLPASPDAMFLVSYDTTGNYLSSMTFDIGGDDYSDVQTDNNGNFYVIGDLAIDSSVVAGDTLLGDGLGGEVLIVAKYNYDSIICCKGSPIPSFTDTGVTTVSFTYTGVNGYDSLRWHFGDGDTSSAPNPVHTYTAPGIYSACVDVYSHCLPPEKPFVYACRNIAIDEGLKNTSNPDNINIYPNPANSQITISSARQQISEVTITDVLGQTAFSGRFNARHADIDIALLPSGVYFVKVNNTQVLKFSKK